MAEFDDPDALLAAARAARDAGYRRMEAYTPQPVHGLTEALGRRPTRLPWIVLGGGLAGAVAGFGLQYWINVVAYPLNIGGRPLNSWPAFIPPTFETTVLFSAGTAVVAMLALNKLPMPYHPVFNVKEFERASTDRFFLCIEAGDPLFHHKHTRTFLLGLEPLRVQEVKS
ncbi:MAG: DUF3341 domain-containing protein [Planctomycetota bacterium]|nr:MAG: DUF3341 domain-containing protein [Planctomycetota bacterium]